MSGGIINIMRRPLEGQSKNVLKAAINTLEQRSVRGNVASSLTTPDPATGGNVMTTINHDSLSSMEDQIRAFADSEKIQDSWDQTAAMCKSVTTAILEYEAPVEGASEAFQPKYMVSIFLKRGMRQELIDAMLKIRSGMSGIKPSILKPLGMINRVRITAVYENLEDLSTALNNQSPEAQTQRAKMIDLTDSYFRTISRIHDLYG